MVDASNINIRALLIFIDVYEAQNFSVVARRQGISASQISRVIHQLEDALGQQLFYRNTRAVIPTESGHLFIRYARSMAEILKRRAGSWTRVRWSRPVRSALTDRCFSARST
jgi:DNA-binding transcriptional LysR family regulator